jgi:hypothetical protein
MRCAFAVTAVVLASSISLSAAAQEPFASVLVWSARSIAPESSPVAGADRQALMLNLTTLDRATVRRAIDLALAKLAWPGCPSVYEAFELPNGGTPRSELDRIGIGPEEWLESLVFIDGSRDPVCRIGRAALTTTPGSQVIRVCPGFARFQLQDPGRSASLIIHESLHALGLGENPPSSSEITQHVERQCWKAATRMPKPPRARATAPAGFPNTAAPQLSRRSAPG